MPSNQHGEYRRSVQFFGVFAGVDVRKAVPASHILDSRFIPYLTNVAEHSPNQFHADLEQHPHKYASGSLGLMFEVSVLINR